MIEVPHSTMSSAVVLKRYRYPAIYPQLSRYYRQDPDPATRLC